MSISKKSIPVLLLIAFVYFPLTIYAQLSYGELKDKVYLENVVSWDDINSDPAGFCRGDIYSSNMPKPIVLTKLKNAFSERLLMYKNKLDEFDTREEHEKRVTQRLLNDNNVGNFKNRILKNIPVCPLPPYNAESGGWSNINFIITAPGWQNCGNFRLNITLPKEEARKFKKIYPLCTMTVKYGFYWLVENSNVRLRPKFELYSIHLEKDGEIIYTFDLKEDFSNRYYRCFGN